MDSRDRRGNQPTTAFRRQSETTLYGFDTNGVNETEANVIFNDAFSFNQQGLLATDGSWQSTSTFNMSLPDGYGNLWGRASTVPSVTRSRCSRMTT